MAEDHEKLRGRKDKKDPKLSRKPEVPINGVGKGGRITSNSTLTQYVARNIAVDKTKDEDPREAILAKASRAGEEINFILVSYSSLSIVPLHFVSSIRSHIGAGNDHSEIPRYSCSRTTAKCCILAEIPEQCRWG